MNGQPSLVRAVVVEELAKEPDKKVMKSEPPSLVYHTVLGRPGWWRLNVERTLKEHNMLVVHFEILAKLSAAPDHTLLLSTLAELANLSQSRLTNRIKTLTKRGEVVIRPDPADGRAKLATLTKTGLERLERVAADHVREIRHLVFDNLDANETAVFADAFAKIAANLCEQQSL
jgi:DNA-binding MarR family transcriptional regulator